jgi:hypothetical protein
VVGVRLMLSFASVCARAPQPQRWTVCVCFKTNTAFLDAGLSSSGIRSFAITSRSSTISLLRYAGRSAAPRLGVLRAKWRLMFRVIRGLHHRLPGVAQSKRFGLHAQWRARSHGRRAACLGGRQHRAFFGLLEDRGPSVQVPSVCRALAATHTYSALRRKSSAVRVGSMLEPGVESTAGSVGSGRVVWVGTRRTRALTRRFVGSIGGGNTEHSQSTQGRVAASASHLVLA